VDQVVNEQMWGPKIPQPQPPAEKPRFLPDLAEAIAEWFPELQGRAFAVSDATITKDNVPTLPLVMIAITRSVGSQGTHGRQEIFEIADAFVVEFWLEPARYKRANGSETPFWSYYPYESIRDTLLENLARWQPRGGERIAYRSMTVEADALAVTLTFGFIATMRWCPSPSTEKGEPFKIGFNLCTPEGCCPETCYEEVRDPACPDPCK
jgi:hypothetical protein